MVEQNWRARTSPPRVTEVLDGEMETKVKFLETARQARSIHRLSFDGTDQNLVRLPDDAMAELVKRLAREVDRRICQIVPFASRQRPTDSFSEILWRRLAATGACVVSRLYLVPRGQVSRELVERRISDDHASRVDSRSLAVGGAMERTEVPMADTWLIDDQVVVRREQGTSDPPTWVVSAKPHDVVQVRRLWDALWEKQEHSQAQHEEHDLTDPLLETAPIVYAAAPMSCTANYIDTESCSWYHRVWQYLRLFDMVSSPGWHAEFYERTLRYWIERSARRVLITGAADYSTLSYLLAAADECGHLQDLDVHVMDMCPTPLNLCRWYAHRMGVRAAVHCADILDSAPALVGELTAGARDRGFDLILSDAFLTRFTATQAADVVRNWSALLRDGGAVVTTVRLHPRNQRKLVLPVDASEFELRLRQRAERWIGMLSVDIEELVDATYEYALKITSNDLGDEADVVSLLEVNGFYIQAHDIASVRGELQPTQYLRLVAVKRSHSSGPRKDST